MNMKVTYDKFQIQQTEYLEEIYSIRFLLLEENSQINQHSFYFKKPDKKRKLNAKQRKEIVKTKNHCDLKQRKMRKKSVNLKVSSLIKHILSTRPKKEREDAKYQHRERDYHY